MSAWASGGVGSREDVVRLAELKGRHPNLEGVIVGKALYEKRVDLADLRSVVYALVQADELGVSIGAILRIQSDQMRQRRFDRAERLANEAPVKLLGPLMLFIFPSVFIVLLGPILTQAMGRLF